jgi:hypothetical protein
MHKRRVRAPISCTVCPVPCNFSKSPGNLPIVSITLLRRARRTAERRHPAISYKNLTSQLFKALEAEEKRLPLPLNGYPKSKTHSSNSLSPGTIPAQTGFSEYTGQVPSDSSLPGKQWICNDSEISSRKARASQHQSGKHTSTRLMIPPIGIRTIHVQT